MSIEKRRGEDPERIQPELRSPDSPDGWRRVGLGSRERERPSATPAERERRRDTRLVAQFPIHTTWIDPVRDPVTRELCYWTSDEDEILNLSRRGARLRSARPPDIGTRLLLELHPHDARGPLELIGRTRWTRVEFVPGECGARARAGFGVELLGGARAALDRYEAWLARLHQAVVATGGSLG